MQPADLLYISPLFPKRRHGFELAELRELHHRAKLLILSLRKPAASEWSWLESSGGGDLASCILALRPRDLALAGLLNLLTLWFQPEFWRFIAISLRTRSAKGLAAAFTSPLLARAASLRLRGHAYTRIHADFASLPASVALFLHLQTGKPFSFCGHAFDVFSNVPAGPASEGLLRRKLLRAKVLFAANSAVARRMQQLLPQTAAKIILKRNGVAPKPPTVIHTLQARPRFIFMGELVEKKGLDYALLALRQIKVDFVLEVYGSGALEKRWRDLAAPLGDKVVFKGPYSLGDMPAIFSGTRAIIMPSVVLASGDSDGVPTVLLEAAAFGVPGISSAVGAITDFVRHEETGLIVGEGDPGALVQAVTRAIKDPALMAALGERARELVFREFNAGIECDKLIYPTT